MPKMGKNKSNQLVTCGREVLHYQCMAKGCTFGFRSPHGLVKHYLDKHAEPSSYQCSECDQHRVKPYKSEMYGPKHKCWNKKIKEDGNQDYHLIDLLSIDHTARRLLLNASVPRAAVDSFFMIPEGEEEEDNECCGDEEYLRSGGKKRKIISPQSHTAVGPKLPESGTDLLDINGPTLTELLNSNPGTVMEPDSIREFWIIVVMKSWCNVELACHQKEQVVDNTSILTRKLLLRKKINRQHRRCQ